MPRDNKIIKDKYADLRRQIDVLLANKEKDLGFTLQEELRKLFHELQVHQIELEMQNDELRRVQIELDESRQKYVDLYDFAPVGYLTLSDKGMVLGANLTLADMLGLERAKVVGQRFSAFVADEDQDIYCRHYNALWAQGKKQTCEIRLKCFDGATVWVRLEGSLAEAADGRQMIRCIISELSELRQAEHQLKVIGKDLQDERLKNDAILSVIGMGVCIQDRNHRVLYENPAHQKMLGNNTGRFCYEAYHNLKEECENCPVAMSWESGKICSVVKKVQTRSETMYFEVTASPVKNYAGEVAGGVEIVRDITEARVMEEKLHQSEMHYRQLFDHMGSGVAVYRAVEQGGDFVFVDFNAAAERIEKISKEDIVEKSVLEIFPNVKEFGIFEVFQRVWQSGKPERYPVAKYVDGRIEGWRDNYVYRLPCGELVAVYDDVTELKQAEENLLQSEKRYRRLVEMSPDILYVYSNVRGSLYWSASVEKILGFSQEALQDDPMLWYDSIHPDDRKKVDAAIAEAKEGKGFNIEYRIKDATGNYLWFQDRHIHSEQKNDEIIIEGLAIDITDRKMIETMLLESYDDMEDMVAQQTAELVAIHKQLMHADKLNSLGKLAASIAHEIRNPLSGININLNTLEKTCRMQCEPETLTSLFDQLKKASRKIESVIRRVMDFSKPSTPKFRITDINNAIEESVQFTEVNLRQAGISVHMHLAERLPQVWLDTHMFGQVIVNLLTNSAEAMQGQTGVKEISVTSSGGKGNVVVTVSDNGPGIPASQRENIFEPFFTTKVDGTGIGLSICNRIIVDHHGSITITSSESGGAAFVIKLPVDRRRKTGDNVKTGAPLRTGYK